MDEAAPSTSSTLSNYGMKTMSRLFKTTASLCSIFAVNFRNWAEEHGLGIGEHLSSNGTLVLSNISYSIQRDLKEDHAEYDMLSTNVMKDMATVLRDVMKLGVRNHVFSSSLQNALLYKDISS